VGEKEGRKRERERVSKYEQHVPAKKLLSPTDLYS